ncbi:MAG TPA: helical backbone metal receptor [Bryobacteraceae bacterium]|nr:helical backbone metal receptor [Bryobacteraceae bacterium]
MGTLRRLLSVFLVAALVTMAADPVPHRIASLSPSTTEILYGVGAFPRVIAVSQYCSYPPEVAKLPRIGGWQTSDIESIVAIHPDLVVLTKAQEPFIVDRLQAFGLHWIAVPSESLADVFTAIDTIGKATGNSKQSADLIRQTHASLDNIRRATKVLPRRSVLLSVSRTPGTLSDLYVATEGSYLIDLVEIAGGRSAVAPARTGYGKISKEAILTLNPEVIIDLVPGSKSKLAEHTTDVWNDLPELRAVREKHVYAVDDQFVPHPSQFVTHTAEIFEKILHPEALKRGGH